MNKNTKIGLFIILILFTIGGGQKQAVNDSIEEIVIPFTGTPMIYKSITTSFGQKEAFFSCTDTDGGLDWITFGMVNDNLDRDHYDVCSDDQTLQEQQCDSSCILSEGCSGWDTITASAADNPEWKCEGGKFVPTTVCQDTDGGQVYSVKGTASLVLSYTDYCDSDNRLIEYFCEDGALKAITHSPASDETCEDGRIYKTAFPPDPDECIVTTWIPSTTSICSPVTGGTEFTQTSNCDTTKTNTGTKVCSGCINEVWSPATGTKCIGTSFQQVSSCGNVRSATGVMVCIAPPPPPPPSEPFDWDKYIPWIIGFVALIIVLSMMKRKQ